MAVFELLFELLFVVELFEFCAATANVKTKSRDNTDESIFFIWSFF